MKPDVTKRAGKGSQRVFPGRGALNDLVKSRPSINNYAKATPNVVRSGRNVVGKKP